MRTVAEPTFVQTNNIGETRKASIKTSAKMFNFFSKQIYTDFFTAAWRELVSNGIDGQKVNGNTTPPIVTVPSMLDPYAKVRDFGCSMDHEFMLDKFMSFGDASTKEDSDDFIGGFGIGSKAPLAYTEQYSIRCFLDGVVRVYSVFKDDEGCPSIAFLSEEDTTEADGVEVGFPVRQEDIHKFTETVVDTLQYFNPQPVLENTELKLEPIVYDAKGDRWGIRLTNARDSKIIIGGVSYPLNYNSIPYTGYDNLRRFAQLGLDVYLDIGEANIALSREQITHDETLFKRMEEICQNIGPEFGKQISRQFETCSTLWEAKTKLCEVTQTANNAMSGLLKKHAYWKGTPIEPHIRRPADTDFKVLVICYGSFNYQNSPYYMPVTQAVSPQFRAWSDGAHFKPTAFDRIVMDDNPDKPSLRIRTVVDKFPSERILFIRDYSDKKDMDWKKFWVALGSPPASMIDKLSSYDPMKVVRTANGGTSTRPFKCYPRRPHRNSSGELSALPAGGGLYISMDNFNEDDSQTDIGIAQMSEPKNTIWLNKTDLISSGIKNDPDWYDVKAGVQKVKDAYKSTHKKLAEAEAYYQARRDSYLLGNLEEIAKLSSFPKQGPLFQLRKLQVEHGEVATSDHSNIRSKILAVDCSKQLAKVEQLIEAARAKHPFIDEIYGQRYGKAHGLSKELLSSLF